MKRVRWGILGTAEIAREQVIPALKDCSNAELVAIASRGGQASDLVEEFKIPKQYASYEELLKDPEIDAVYVPLPNHLHAEWVKLAASYGKHVLCEKPASPSSEEASEMIEACEEYGVLFMESMMYQFHPQHQRVKELVDSGTIGEVKLVRSAFTFQLEKLNDNFRLLPWEDGGGSLYDIGCYSIHALRSIVGEPVEIMHCSTDNSMSAESDISATAVMKFNNNVIGYFDCGMNMSVRNEYEIVGTEGSIRVPKAFIPQETGETTVEISKNGTTTIENFKANYYVNGLEHFSTCILDNKTPVHDKKETVNNIIVIENCIKKAQENQ